MNDGAKVFEVGVSFREFERGRGIGLLLGATAPVSEEYDWFRLWIGLCVEDNGEDMIMDLGLPLGIFGPGDGDPVLEKGLLRFCPGFDAILKWFVVIRPAEIGYVMAAKQHQAMYVMEFRTKKIVKSFKRALVYLVNHLKLAVTKRERGKGSCSLIVVLSSLCCSQARSIVSGCRFHMSTMLARFLQQVPVDESASNCSSTSKFDPNKFPKSR